MSLSDLVPRKPSSPPSVFRSESGLEVEIKRCADCGRDYSVSRSPRLQVSAGECSHCADLERRAQAQLQASGEAISRRVEQRLAESESARQKRGES
jgi:hypothetical protein